jgi:hypothetical protein
MVERMKTARVSCHEVLPLLDIVVSDRMAGLPVDKHYPAVFYHLENCPTCGQTYKELVEALQQEKAGAVLRAPLQRPPTPAGNGWSLQALPADAGSDWRTLSCTMSPSHLEALLAQSPVANRQQRTGPAGVAQWLLMADVLRLPQAIVAVQITLHSQWSHVDHVSLSADFSSDHPLPHPLKANLDWGSEHRQAALSPAGQVEFPNLPTSLCRAPIAELSLYLEPAAAGPSS